MSGNGHLHSIFDIQFCPPECIRRGDDLNSEVDERLMMMIGACALSRKCGGTTFSRLTKHNNHRAVAWTLVRLMIPGGRSNYEGPGPADGFVTAIRACGLADGSAAKGMKKIPTVIARVRSLALRARLPTLMRFSPRYQICLRVAAG
jgi:hypothetical protein